MPSHICERFSLAFPFFDLAHNEQKSQTSKDQTANKKEEGRRDRTPNRMQLTYALNFLFITPNHFRPFRQPAAGVTWSEMFGFVVECFI